MFQRSQIGKKRSRQTQAEAILNSIYVTPNNDKYSLIRIENVGRSKIYVYEFTLSNETAQRRALEIMANNSIRCQFKHLISCADACEFIESIMDLLKNSDLLKTKSNARNLEIYIHT